MNIEHVDSFSMKLLNHLGSLEIRMKNFVHALALSFPLQVSFAPLLSLFLAIFITRSTVHTRTVCHSIALLPLVGVVVAVVNTIKPTDRTQCDRTHLLSSM